MIRDQARGSAEGTIVRLGHAAGFFVMWLLQKAGGNGGGTPFPEAFVQVRAAVEDSQARTQLGAELREFLEGCVSGEIDDDEWTRRLRASRAQRR